MFKKFFISLAFLIFVLAPVLVPNASAAGDSKPPQLIGGSLLPGTGNAEAAIRQDSSAWLQNIFLNKVINILIGLTAALAVLFLILGGYQYLTAVGNEEQIKQAHKTITWSLAGLLLALLAFAIVQILVNIDFEPAAKKVETNLLAADVVSPIAEILPFADPGWEGDAAIKNLPTADFKEEFLPVVARFLIFGMAFVAFLVFFVAGVWLVVGWGEEESIKKAKNAIIWGVVGLAFAAASYVLVKGILEVDLGWCGNEIQEEGEQCDGSDGVGAGEECVDCKLSLKCLELVVDGLLGPNTDKARKETPNLAADFEEDEEIECVDEEKLETIAEMPLQEASNQWCNLVKEFQEAFNNQTCDGTTGTRKDYPAGEKGEDVKEMKTVWRTICVGDWNVCISGKQTCANMETKQALVEQGKSAPEGEVWSPEMPQGVVIIERSCVPAKQE